MPPRQNPKTCVPPRAHSERSLSRDQLGASLSPTNRDGASSRRAKGVSRRRRNSRGGDAVRARWGRLSRPPRRRSRRSHRTRVLRTRRRQSPLITDPAAPPALFRARIRRVSSLSLSLSLSGADIYIYEIPSRRLIPGTTLLFLDLSPALALFASERAIQSVFRSYQRRGSGCGARAWSCSKCLRSLCRVLPRAAARPGPRMQTPSSCPRKATQAFFLSFLEHAQAYNARVRRLVCANTRRHTFFLIFPRGRRHPAACYREKTLAARD